ncbi:MAG: hypothetical protein GC206_00385 [Alphaproteobacteria bacterium]|nr:hypothetical protein [Alphaproteobacteria bacterium]
MAAIALVALAALPAAAQTVAIHGLSGEVVEYDAAASDVPRQTLQVTQQGTERVYEGAPLAALLALVEAPLGTALRGDALTLVVLVRCADGYEVAIALADMDPAMTGRTTLLADRVDAAALGQEDGPYRLVIAATSAPPGRRGWSSPSTFFASPCRRPENARLARPAGASYVRRRTWSLPRCPTPPMTPSAKPSPSTTSSSS